MEHKLLISFCFIAGYFLLNALVVILLHKPQKTFEEYSVGSRSFGWLLTCFSFMGGFYVGSIYTIWFTSSADIGMFTQYYIIYATGCHIVLYLMAKPVWIWGKVYGLQTQGDLIQLRYGSKGFKLLFSMLVFFFWFPWLILEMEAIGEIASIMTYEFVNQDIGMIFVCLFVIIYVFYGGVRAGATGALFQGLTFILIGTVVLYFLIRQAFGGILPLYSFVEQTQPQLLTLHSQLDGNRWASNILVGILGEFCWPGIFCNLYVGENSNTFRKAIFISPLVGIVIVMFSLLLGLGGGLLEGFPAQGQLGLFFMASQFGGPVALALVGIAVLAACTATISGILSCAASLLTKDFELNKIGNDQDLLICAKKCTIIAGLVALWIATVDFPSLMSIAILMYDCVVQAIIPLLVGLYWKKSNLPGAAFGMLTGIGITLVGNIFPGTIVWAGGWSAGMLGLAFNLIIHVALGFALGKPEHVDALFQTISEYKEVQGQKSKLI